jgi:hypothetical protein
VVDDTTYGIPLSSKELDIIREYFDTISNCGVVEEQFPCIGKCYSKNYSNSGIYCYSKCVHCSIWTSIPDGASLDITHIFGCTLYGYDKRIKE